MSKTFEKSEEDWQAEYDADTMARYEEIMGDKKRRERAIRAAKRKAKELQKRADDMTNVTKK